MDGATPAGGRPDRGRAVVFGLGRFGGGAGAARHLAREGWDVLATDLRTAAELEPTLAALADVPVRYALGGHRPEDFERADLVVANPAVRPDSDLLARARRGGARITTEVELFLDRAPGPLLAVTGTQGKSSTVRMAADLLRAAGVPARAGGNLGGSLLDELDELGDDEVVVLELSSYQLEHMGSPTPRMAAVAVTNVGADHLERHGTTAAYRAAKRRLLDLVGKGGTAFLPGDDAALADWRPAGGTRVDVWPERPGGPGLFVDEGLFRWDEEPLGRAADLPLAGAFQRVNALFALGLARTAGAAATRLAAAVPSARGLEHRLEDLGVRGGRRVVDNAVSTTPDSTISALRELRAGCTLLCGGQAKRGLALAPLADACRERGARAVVFGASAPELAAAFRAAGVPTAVVAGVDEAVGEAWREGDHDGDVLFSPACASFDAYPNFRARARAFRMALPPPGPAPKQP
ncbi:MAG: UDP-N-acetylmuramoyl-L-alanine--D-glutamate ligase [Planctomycetota bacterium]